MNICMLSELFYPFMMGGAERRYYEIAKRLAKRHEVTVYSLRFYGSPRQEVFEGINIVRVGSNHPLNVRKLPTLSTYFPAFFRVVAGKYDVIDANQGISSFIGLFKSFISEPVVATFHDLYWNQWHEYFRTPFSSIGKTMEFLWSKLDYSRIIAVSPTTKKKLIYLGFRSPIDVVASGIDKDFIEKVRAKKDRHSVAFVGRLVKYKNVDALIRAFAEVQKEYRDAMLKIVGTGPEEANLRNLAGSLGVNAEFYGFVDEEEKIKIIKSSEVLVNPSSVEGLGLILIEAMACNTPVVAKNLETYFFCNKNNSIMYNNDEDMAWKIMDVMSSKATSKKLKKYGARTATEFSWDNVAKNVERIYEDLI
jgi:glycosyltransferase involved in cell wall biosynthesis